MRDQNPRQRWTEISKWGLEEAITEQSSGKTDGDHHTDADG